MRAQKHRPLLTIYERTRKVKAVTQSLFVFGQAKRLCAARCPVVRKLSTQSYYGTRQGTVFQVEGSSMVSTDEADALKEIESRKVEEMASRLVLGNRRRRHSRGEMQVVQEGRRSKRWCQGVGWMGR